jgi:hypothetical protein
MRRRLRKPASGYSWVWFLLVFPVAFVAVSVHIDGLRAERDRREELQGVEANICPMPPDPLDDQFLREFAVVSIGGFVLVGLASMLGDVGDPSRGPRPFHPAPTPEERSPTPRGDQEAPSTPE